MVGGQGSAPPLREAVPPRPSYVKPITCASKLATPNASRHCVRIYCGRKSSESPSDCPPTFLHV
eukprot:6214681-Pleurochrysis_carterae.AAC.3